MESSPQRPEPTDPFSRDYNAYADLRDGRTFSFVPKAGSGSASSVFTLSFTIRPAEKVDVDTAGWVGMNVREIASIDPRTRFPAASGTDHYRFQVARRDLISAKLTQVFLGRVREGGLDLGMPVTLDASEALMDATNNYHRLYDRLKNSDAAGRATAAGLALPGGPPPPQQNPYSWPAPRRPGGDVRPGHSPGTGRS
ncbi:hypothetical protein [Micromonospora sp. SH-82]|uniref:hypothetical protein n=1 Tax=Micromonospora sp. SH-82 TaxID=3132938 RepID=UPI003EB9AFB0